MLFVSRYEFPKLNSSTFVGEISKKKSEYTPTTGIKFSGNGLCYKDHLQVIFVLLRKFYFSHQQRINKNFQM